MVQLPQSLEFIHMPNVKRTIPNQFRAALKAGNPRLARVEVIVSQLSDCRYRDRA